MFGLWNCGGLGDDQEEIVIDSARFELYFLSFFNPMNLISN